MCLIPLILLAACTHVSCSAWQSQCTNIEKGEWFFCRLCTPLCFPENVAAPSKPIAINLLSGMPLFIKHYILFQHHRFSTIQFRQSALLTIHLLPIKEVVPPPPPPPPPNYFMNADLPPSWKILKETLYSNNFTRQYVTSIPLIKILYMHTHLLPPLAIPPVMPPLPLQMNMKWRIYFPGKATKIY